MSLSAPWRIGCFALLLVLGGDVRAGEGITVTRLSAAPRLDGSMEDAVWRSSEAGSHPIADAQGGVRGEVRIGCDDEMLFFAATCEEAGPQERIEIELGSLAGLQRRIRFRRDGISHCEQWNGTDWTSLPVQVQGGAGEKDRVWTVECAVPRVFAGTGAIRRGAEIALRIRRFSGAARVGQFDATTGVILDGEIPAIPPTEPKRLSDPLRRALENEQDPICVQAREAMRLGDREGAAALLARRGLQQDRAVSPRKVEALPLTGKDDDFAGAESLRGRCTPALRNQCDLILSLAPLARVAAAPTADSAEEAARRLAGWRAYSSLSARLMDGRRMAAWRPEFSAQRAVALASAAALFAAPQARKHFLPCLSAALAEEDEAFEVLLGDKGVTPFGVEAVEHLLSLREEPFLPGRSEKHERLRRAIELQLQAHRAREAVGTEELRLLRALFELQEEPGRLREVAGRTLRELSRITLSSGRLPRAPGAGVPEELLAEWASRWWREEPELQRFTPEGQVASPWSASEFRVSLGVFRAREGRWTAALRAAAAEPGTDEAMLYGSVFLSIEGEDLLGAPRRGAELVPPLLGLEAGAPPVPGMLLPHRRRSGEGFDRFEIDWQNAAGAIVASRSATLLRHPAAGPLALRLRDRLRGSSGATIAQFGMTIRAGKQAVVSLPEGAQRREVDRLLQIQRPPGPAHEVLIGDGACESFRLRPEARGSEAVWPGGWTDLYLEEGNPEWADEAAGQAFAGDWLAVRCGPSGPLHLCGSEIRMARFRAGGDWEMVLTPAGSIEIRVGEEGTWTARLLAGTQPAELRIRRGKGSGGESARVPLLPETPVSFRLLAGP